MLLLFGFIHASAACGEGRDLFAHGGMRGEEAAGFWVSRLDTRDPKQDRSVFLERDRTNDNLWNELAQIPSRTALLTNDGAELVAVFAPIRGELFAREWAWISPARFSYGPVLARDARIAAMAGGKGLWALGVSAAEPPVSRPATFPATRPAGMPLTLYQLKGEWQAVPGAWPDDLSVLEMSDVSMLLINETVFVAARTRRHTLRLLKYERNRWQAVAEVASNVKWTMLTDLEKREPVGAEVSQTTPPRHFKLLNLQGKPAIWIQPGDADADAAGMLWTSEGWCNLEMPHGKLRAVAMDAAIFRDQPRLYYLVEERPNEQARLFEQVVTVEGKFVGKPQPIVYARKQGAAELNWVTITVMAVLTVVILNMVLRRRGEDSEERRGDGD